MKKWIEENSKLYGFISLVALAFGSIAYLTALFLNHDGKLPQIIGGIVVLITLPILIWFEQYLKKNEQSRIWTLFTNELLPNKEKTYLIFKMKILVVEDGIAKKIAENKESKTYFSAYKKEFENLLNEDLINKIGVRNVQTDSDDTLNSKELDFELFQFNSAINKEEKKRVLSNSLEKVDAVIVIRTNELEKNIWVYDILEKWAIKNSQKPCLIVDKVNITELGDSGLSTIPERYSHIHAKKQKHRQSLPWYLTQRASERSLLWRNQASYNRIIAIGSLILLLTFGVYYFFSNQYFQLRENYENVRIIYKETANHTKNIFSNDTVNCNDENLHISYWVGYENSWLGYSKSVYQLNTSENKLPDDRTVFSQTDTSIIGSAFSRPNSIVKGEKGKATQIASIENFEFVDCPECYFFPESHRDVNKIVCSSYNRTDAQERTVGICIDTKNQTDIFSDKSLKFLSERTREFYNAVSPLLYDKKLMPQRQSPKTSLNVNNVNANNTNVGNVNANNTNVGNLNSNINNVCVSNTTTNSFGNKNLPITK